MANPGELRDVLVIQEQESDPSRDAGGRPTTAASKVWSDVATVRGDVMEGGGGEIERGGRNVPSESVQVKMRDHPKLTTKARLKWANNGDQILRIQSISRTGEMDRDRMVSCTYGG
jgi:head-tail adaptor